MLEWVENTGDGTFGTRHPISLAGRKPNLPWLGGIIGGSISQGPVPPYSWIGPGQTLVMDADGDGDTDIITIPSALGNRLTLHRNTGSGFALEALAPPLENFPQAPSFGLAARLPELRAGRFHASSEPLQFAILLSGSDVLGNPLSVLWLVRGSAGGLTAGEPSSLPFAGTMAIVDFDGDGLDDIITGAAPSYDTLGNPAGGPAIHYHRNRGDWTLQAPVLLAMPAGNTSTLIAGDFNGDGLTDIIAASTDTGNIDLYLHETLAPIPGYAEWIANFNLADSSPLADPTGMVVRICWNTPSGAIREAKSSRNHRASM